MPTTTTFDLNSSANPSAPDWIALVREKVDVLRFGVVPLVVHDGRAKQIERKEKTRLPASQDQGSE